MAHGPDSSYIIVEADSFWDVVYAASVSCHVKGENVTMFIDGNCRITAREGSSDVIIGNVLDPDFGGIRTSPTRLHVSAADVKR